MTELFWINDPFSLLRHPFRVLFFHSDLTENEEYNSASRLLIAVSAGFSIYKRSLKPLVYGGLGLVLIVLLYKYKTTMMMKQHVSSETSKYDQDKINRQVWKEAVLSMESPRSMVQSMIQNTGNGVPIVANPMPFQGLRKDILDGTAPQTMRTSGSMLSRDPAIFPHSLQMNRIPDPTLISAGPKFEDSGKYFREPSQTRLGWGGKKTLNLTKLFGQEVNKQ